MATLPTCSGVFFRLHCRHQQLFEKEYKRSNRNRGTKILRCFPHCCPSHVERSYCGSSLELAVEFHQPLYADATSLFVFARFETVDLATSLAVGDYSSLAFLQNVSQSEANPEATWIQGALQSRAASPTTRVFLLNGLTSSKWYYHWESGANKARRLTKHLLKAYILYRRPQPPGSAGGDAADRVQVIGTVSSPPFTLVSYRRAAWEGLEGVDGAAYPTDGDVGDEYNLHQVVQDQISQAFQDFQKQSEPDPRRVATTSERLRIGSYLDHEQQRQQQQQRDSMQGSEDAAFEHETKHEGDDDDDCGCTSCGHYRRARPAPASAVVCDQWLWERQHTAMTMHMKDVAIIYYFVSNVPMALAMQSVRVREHVYTALQRHWAIEEDETALRPTARRRFSAASTAAPATMPQPAVLLSLLFPGRDGAATAVGPAHTLDVSGSESGAALNAQVENLLVIVAKLAIWLLSRETVELFQAFFDAHANVLLQKRSLRDAFLHCAGLLCKRIHIFWSREVKIAAHDGASPRDSAFKALRTMSEHIIALSHAHVRFQTMWPDLREILEAPGTIMWESFVAQLRETYSRKRPASRTRRDRDRDRDRLERAPRHHVVFSGEWVLDASTTTVDRAPTATVPPLSRLNDSPSMGDVLLTMAQLQHVHLYVPAKDLLWLRSDSSLLPDENPWTKLVCDGRARSTGAFPIGLSCLVGSQLLGGDYVASLDATRARIQIELFWWPLHIGTSRHATQATRVVLTLMVLPVDAATVQGTFELQHGAIARNDSDRDRERLTRIDLWSPKQRTALRVGWVPLWRAHVRFTRRGDETAHSV